MKRIVLTLLVIVSMTSITSSNAMNSENITVNIIDEPCCQNGYKTWKKRALLGGNVNFFDCQCAYYFARPQTECTCEGGGEDL